MAALVKDGDVDASVLEGLVPNEKRCGAEGDACDRDELADPNVMGFDVVTAGFDGVCGKLSLFSLVLELGSDAFFSFAAESRFDVSDAAFISSCACSFLSAVGGLPKENPPIGTWNVGGFVSEVGCTADVFPSKNDLVALPANEKPVLGSVGSWGLLCSSRADLPCVEVLESFV